MTQGLTPPSDVWSNWLLHDRHGGDVVHEKRLRAEVDRYADRVLDGLALTPGMTLLDIGTGDGLVAFRAIDRIGTSLKVILLDISDGLLRHAQARALSYRVAGQCRFVQASAEQLIGVGDDSVDALSMRAVLSYVHDKRAALGEAHRVLRPGGRISFAEPILQDEALNAVALRRIAEAPDDSERHACVRLLHRWKSAQFPDTMEALAADPLVNCSERDLLALVQDAGFVDIRLELHIGVHRCDGIPWATFLATSPHPLAPSLRAILDERFDADEQMAFERLLRPSVECGVDNAIERLVYLTAVKPAVSAAVAAQQVGQWNPVTKRQRQRTRFLWSVVALQGHAAPIVENWAPPKRSARAATVNLVFKPMQFRTGCRLHG